jgi:hypothetical protein
MPCIYLKINTDSILFIIFNLVILTCRQHSRIEFPKENIGKEYSQQEDSI